MRLASLALDSVDNLHYGCTTHFSSLLLGRLGASVRLADLPLLVRLNPGVPWKTRGNGAVVLRLYYDGEPWELLEVAYSLALEYSSGKSDVGVVVYEGEPWGVERLRWLYTRGLTSILTLDVVTSTLSKLGGLHAGGRGVIGATAALAALGPHDDFTFELIAYRDPGFWGSRRCVDEVKALIVESRLPPCTFYNVDMLTGEFTASPGGSDPVLAGFRGNCLTPLFEYSQALCEKPHFWTLFRSNQHTDAHMVELEELAPYNTGYVEAVVSREPDVIEGSHVVVRASTKLGEVDLVFYRETGPLNKVARMLVEGDRVRALGSIRPYRPRGVPVLAVEKLQVLEVARSYVEVNPRCPICSTRMESVGSGKGFRCDRCGYESRGLGKVRIEAGRRLTPGTYVTSRLKHLTEPPGRRRLGGLGSNVSLSVSDVIFTEAHPRPTEALLRLEEMLASRMSL
ncbi:MAG: TiaS agmantine-binding domain-containing protein [Acidilobaceae archaeon]